MRIAQIAPLYESVPPQRYGGTERVVAHLTDELVARGHEVTLFASADSVTRARLVPACRRGLRMEGRKTDAIALHLAMLLDVYARAREFDVIHAHTDYLGLPLARGCPTPTVLTLHGRLDIAEAHAVYRAVPEASFVSISDAQRLPLAGVPWAATVHHGLPPRFHHFHPTPGRYLLFLGRISPEKRPDTAIRVALAAGVPLKIAAKVDPIDGAYFEDVIRPLLRHPLVDFIGEVDEPTKGRLLAGALALLFPIDWPEPFGLVLIEALACGTPVIARRRGSVPEIIRDGVTGYLRETEEELTGAVRRVQALSRAACRMEFEQRFSAGRMVDDYLRVYAQAARFAPAAGRGGVDRRVDSQPPAAHAAMTFAADEEPVAVTPGGGDRARRTV
jgi:glycosyltransferase involved in cell wall biosynthesis